MSLPVVPRPGRRPSLRRASGLLLACGLLAPAARSAWQDEAAASMGVGEGEAVTGYPARPLRPYLKGAALMLRLPEFVAELRSLRERLDRLVERVEGGTGRPAGQERDPEESE